MRHYLTRRAFTQAERDRLGAEGSALARYDCLHARLCLYCGRFIRPSESLGRCPGPARPAWVSALWTWWTRRRALRKVLTRDGRVWYRSGQRFYS